MMQLDNWQRLAIRNTSAKPVTRSIVFPFLKFCLKKVAGRSNVFIISERQSSLGNKFYDRNQTLAEAIFNIVGIDWPDWLALYQFFIAINYICD